MLVFDLLIVTLFMQGCTCYTEEEKNRIVQSHNDYRNNVSPHAADMRRLVWDDTVASMARSWVATCPTNHNPQRNNYGENIAFSTVPFNEANLLTGIEKWYDEVEYYTYETGKCTGVCGHYTQVVDSKSLKVGCAMNLNSCSDNKYPYVFVCNYSPGGNVVGKKPYRAGKACSLCPDEAKYCDGGFCTDCSTETGKCACKRVCAHDGTLNKADCSCTCDKTKGFWGNLCTDVCVNSPSCQPYLTWDNEVVCGDEAFYKLCALKCQPDCEFA